MMRKVVILNSSPRKSGSSAAFSEAVEKGVTDTGGEAVRFDLAELTINPCRGCYACQMGHGDPCVQKDDMKQVYDALEKADAVVFATPLYWQQMNGIMKNAIDRLFAMSSRWNGKKDTAMIVSGGSPDGWIYDQVDGYFREGIMGEQVLGWNIVDVINAGGFQDAKSSPYYEKAYELGKKMGGALN